VNAKAGRSYFKGQKRAWSHKSVLSLMALARAGEEPEDVIVRLARELVDRSLGLGWSGPPFDPRILASLCGIDVEPASCDINADARILPLPGGKLVIQYEPTKPTARTNFSICHEIIHTLFPDAYETVHHRKQLSQADHEYLELEWLCDLAAAELLLPHASFTAHLAEFGLTLHAVRKLCTLYEASGEAVLIRISQLSAQPCAIVFLSEKFKPVEKVAMQTADLDLDLPSAKPKLRVDYTRRSKNFNVFIPENKSIPNNSIVYTALAGTEIVEGEEQWDIQAFPRSLIQAVRVPHLANHTGYRVAALLLPL